MSFRLLIASLILLIYFSGNAQDEQGFPEKALTDFVLNQHQEKVYLHLSKKHFVAGETIWFKGYLIEPGLSRPGRSNVMYIELINAEKDIVASRVLEVTQGTAKGDIILPQSLIEGTYQIRAYTNWMRNFSANHFFNEIISITSEINQPEVDQNELINNPIQEGINLFFFPEGGDLIADFPSRVAFKAVDDNGLSLETSGIIFDESGNKVTEFNTEINGLGEFLIRPEVGKKYIAKVENTDLEFPLPVVKESGVSMSVRNSESADFIQVNIQSRGINLDGGTLVGHINGNLIFESKSQTENVFSVVIPKKAFVPGVAHLTFFDKNKVPFAERLVFVSFPEDHVKAIFDNPIYSTRGLVQMDLQLQDTLAKSLSMTVTPVSERHFDDGRNIENYFLLGSDLTGRIESPDYYFGQSENSFNHLDLLLRTQGWSRFDWEELLNESFQNEYILEEGLTIKAQVIDYFDQAKPRRAKFSLVTLENGFMQVQGETDETGIFSITGLQFSDTTKLALTAQGFRGKKDRIDEWVKVKLLESPPPEIPQPMNSTNPPETFEDKSAKLNDIWDSYNVDPDATMLDELTVTSSSLKQDPFERPGNIYGFPSNRVVPDSIGWVNSAQSAFDFLRLVPGVQVAGSFPNQSVQIRGQGTLTAGLEPLYILNGIPVDGGTISTIPVQDVGFIDVLKGADAAIYGARGARGVVIVYTKTGQTREIMSAKGILSFNYPGYYQSRVFFSPDYSEKKQEHIIPDYRSVLYWNPELNIAENKSHVEFYSSDEKGEFEIRIEGINEKGEPIFIRQSIFVE